MLTNIVPYLISNCDLDLGLHRYLYYVLILKIMFQQKSIILGTTIEKRTEVSKVIRFFYYLSGKVTTHFFTNHWQKAGEIHSLA